MMRSSSSNAAAATPEHETPHVLNECQIQKSHPQSVRNPPTYCISTAGVLRYNRESDDNRTKVSKVLSKLPPLAKYAVKCEHCGEKASPSLDLTWLQKPMTAQRFCCAQHEQLCKMLVKERDLSVGRCGLSTIKEEDEFLDDMLIGLRAQSDVSINRGYSIQVATESFAPRSNIFRFRLSSAPGKGNWTVCSSTEPERCLTTEQEETQALVPCDHKPLKFGMCHHQDGSEFLLKYYSSGKKFLTLFRDGSSQIFYPSGQLALLVVTEENGRVCIVYDDSNAPNQVMRAVFQSDGRAACYHSNGNIWLSLNTSGGECLDKTGARVRRWSWDGPLHPVFLSLNKAVGVRVLGREQVFVSFLVQGQQAKFRVGTCSAQGESDTDGSASGLSVTRCELIALAARERTQLAIQKFQQCLMTHI
nr:PREDICTED: glutamate-rich protein 6 isoform X2 [Paralichthys olivaceus]